MSYITKKLATIIMFLLVTSHVHATIIYDTFGDNDSYNPYTALTIGAATTDTRYPPLEQGIGFTATDSGILSELTLSLFLLRGSNEININFMSDENGQPGAILETFNLIDQLGSFGASPVTVSSTSAINILAGVNYWVIASAPQPDTYAGWGFTTVQLPANTKRATRAVGDSDWSILNNAGTAALRVTTVPEPGTLLLFGTLTFFLTVRKRKTTNA